MILNGGLPMITRLENPAEAAELFGSFEDTMVLSCLSGIMGGVYAVAEWLFAPPPQCWATLLSSPVSPRKNCCAFGLRDGLMSS